MRKVLGFLLFLLSLWIVFSDSPKAEAGGYIGGYRYSSYYQPGYAYYGPSYYNGYSYPAGYYYAPAYYPQVTIYQPYLVPQPVAYTTYQPAVAAPAVSLNRTAEPCADHIKKFELRMDVLEKENASMKKLLATPTPQTQPQQIPQSDQQQQQQPQPRMQQPPTQQQPQQQPTQTATRQFINGLAVMNNRCAKCHDHSIDVDRYGGSFTMTKAGQLDHILNDKEVRLIYKHVTEGSMPKDGPLDNEQGQALIEYVNKMKVAAPAATPQPTAPAPAPAPAK